MDINTSFLEKGITFTSCEEIQKICEPFFLQTHLSYYNYVRVYDDGSRICLSNNKPWMEFVFGNHSQFKITFEEKPEHGQSRYVIWDNVEGINDDSLMVKAREEFDIAHGFTIITSYTGYVEFQYFGTTKQNHHLNNFYINNLDALHNFGMFFRDKAESIIEAAEREKIKLEGHEFFWLTKEEGTGNYVRVQYLTDKNEVERYYLNGDLKNIYLTKREAQCLTALIDGFTAKEIGKLLGISYRTVQNYLEDVKQKLSCHTRSSLVTKAHDSGFRVISDIIRTRYFDQSKAA